MVKSVFSKAWKSSRSPAKQRKYAYNAPAHIKRKMLSSGLAKELRTKHKTRSMTVRKGDKVKVLRGQFKGHIGKIDRTDLDSCKIFVIGAEVIKRDGTKALYPLHPSNVIIVELEMSDKKRSKILERKLNKGNIKPKKIQKDATDKKVKNEQEK